MSPTISSGLRAAPSEAGSSSAFRTWGDSTELRRPGTTTWPRTWQSMSRSISSRSPPSGQGVSGPKTAPHLLGEVVDLQRATGTPEDELEAAPRIERAQEQVPRLGQAHVAAEAQTQVEGIAVEVREHPRQHAACRVGLDQGPRAGNAHHLGRKGPQGVAIEGGAGHQGDRPRHPRPPGGSALRRCGPGAAPSPPP